MFKETSLNNLTETKVRQIAEDSPLKYQSQLHCTGIEMEPELRELFIFGMFSTTAILLIVHFKWAHCTDGWMEGRKGGKKKLT